MTSVLGLVVSGTIIAAATWWMCRRYYLTRYDLHNYRRVRLEAIRVDALYRDKDHNERLARRWEARAVEARAHIGDLTVQLARARRRHRRSAVPAYGIHRPVSA